MSRAASSNGSARSTEDPDLFARAPAKEAERYRRRRRWRTFGVLLLGFVLGVVALFAVGVLMATNS